MEDYGALAASLQHRSGQDRRDLYGSPLNLKAHLLTELV